MVVSDGSINVRCEAIASFEEALGRFAQRTLERLKTAETTICRTIKTLEDRRSNLRREIGQLEDQISRADEDDDISSELQRLNEAEEEWTNLLRWQAEVDAAVQRYHREARKLEAVTTGVTVAARAYLRSLIEDLAAYFGLQKDGLAFEVDTGTALTPTKLPASQPSDLQRVEQDIVTFRSQEGNLAVDAKAQEYRIRAERFPELVALSSEEYLALNRYSQFAYERVNPALRTNDVRELEKLGPLIRLTISGMRKLPIYEGPVFRGTSYLPYAERYVPGAIICEPGFTSTSKNIRLKFPGALQYVIFSKRGRDIGSCSAFGDLEQEVLFEPNSRFEVLDRFEVDGVTTISMREL